MMILLAKESNCDYCSFKVVLPGKEYDALANGGFKCWFRYSAAAAIVISECRIYVSFEVESLNDEFGYSELWTSPAYSNSLPPSSFPIPKFLVKPKRTISLDLLSSPSDIDLPPFAKSAPVSLTRELNPSPGVLCDSINSATQTLHRILNIEIMD
ncbi:putative protein transport protein Sec24-like CEF-like [Capsicum annuum]|nr:putative protein transport protein Sec24-like CEF-like [Capsicum annuum]